MTSWPKRDGKETRVSEGSEKRTRSRGGGELTVSVLDSSLSGKTEGFPRDGGDEGGSDHETKRHVERSQHFARF